MLSIHGQSKVFFSLFHDMTDGPPTPIFSIGADRPPQSIVTAGIAISDCLEWMQNGIDGTRWSQRRKTEEEFSPMEVGRKKIIFLYFFFQYMTDDGLDMRTRRGYETK